LNDQTLPRAFILLFAMMVGGNLVAGIWKNPETSSRTKNRATAVVVAVIGIGGLLLALKVHWYPATDGNSP
jgi:hypothetical protein